MKHGYWIPSPDGIKPIRCSECNTPALFDAVENEFCDFEICRYSSNHCPNCGAKMDGKDNDKGKPESMSQEMWDMINEIYDAFCGEDFHGNEKPNELEPNED